MNQRFLNRHIKVASRYDANATFHRELAKGLPDCDCMICFNSVITDYDGPLISIFIDDPLSLIDRLERAQSHHLITMPDPTLTRLVQERFPHLKIRYLPHGACAGGTPTERTIDLLFAGTYKTPREDLFTTTRTDIPFWEAWRQSDDYYPFGEIFLPEAEKSLRHLRRKQLLDILTEAGICVTLFGHGWESYPHVDKHDYRGVVPMPELTQVYRQTKVVLHTNPPFTADSHERPLTALYQGAAVITDHNPFWAKLPVTTFRVPEEVPDLLSSAEPATLTGHTWADRAKTLMTLLK